MIIEIIKLKELPDAKHPYNIEEGYERKGTMNKWHFNKPTVGDRFWIDGNWSTSAVQEIIDESTFKTYNSIYKYKIIDK